MYTVQPSCTAEAEVLKAWTFDRSSWLPQVNPINDNNTHFAKLEVCAFKRLNVWTIYHLNGYKLDDSLNEYGGNEEIL